MSLQSIDRSLTFVVDWVARLVGWLVVALMLVILADVVSRRLALGGSTVFHELQWHLHTMIFVFTFGFAYVRNAHVRIDTFARKSSGRIQALVEIAGICLFLLPFCAVVMRYGINFAYASYLVGEHSDTPGGIPYRWVIKSTLPLGMFLLMAGGLAVLCRNLVVLSIGKASDAGPDARGLS